MSYVTFEWADEPHASESIKRVDGVEVARNLAPNPSFEDGVGGWSRASGLSSLGLTQWTTAVHVGEWAMTVGTTDAEPDNAHFYLDEPTPIEPGQYPAASVALRAGSGATHARLWFDYRSGGSWHSNGGSGPIFPLFTGDNADNPREVAAGSAAPEGADGFRVLIRLYGGPTLVAPDNGSTHVDGFHIATANTEADALAQVETYFDGDTPNYTEPPFKYYTNQQWHTIEPYIYNQQWVYSSPRQYV